MSIPPVSSEAHSFRKHLSTQRYSCCDRRASDRASARQGAIVCRSRINNGSRYIDSQWRRGTARTEAPDRRPSRICVHLQPAVARCRPVTVDRQQRPASIHLTVTANHLAIVDDYLRDVRESLAELRANPALAKSGSAPMYGMAAKMPVRRLVARNVRKMIADMYKGATP